ncbi:hypothetical protein VB776_09895 [Arcicella sp. DC2W]|uniref:Uncharacterized protein n=1 Tax=Arcicella gelida TaxID=2984195 RepID=A0ABU5S4B2_9BACT|nr:hypothetical protein [Arcicella sp. DC2W]MEA5403226.1 hypothetical protein [Arcicella sp. DC2W]
MIGIANNLNQRLKFTHIHGMERMMKQVNLPQGNIAKILDKYKSETVSDAIGEGSYQGSVSRTP